MAWHEDLSKSMLIRQKIRQISFLKVTHHCTDLHKTHNYSMALHEILYTKCHPHWLRNIENTDDLVILGKTWYGKCAIILAGVNDCITESCTL